MGTGPHTSPMCACADARPGLTHPMIDRIVRTSAPCCLPYRLFGDSPSAYSVHTDRAFPRRHHDPIATVLFGNVENCRVSRLFRPREPTRLGRAQGPARRVPSSTAPLLILSLPVGQNYTCAESNSLYLASPLPSLLFLQ